MNIVSKNRHARLWKSSTIATVNARLADAVISSREIEIENLRLQCLQCHLGPGIYTYKGSPGTHQHDEVQIEIPLSGRFHFTVEDKEVMLLPAQALVIPPHTPHNWATPKGGFMLGIMLKAKDLLNAEADLPYGRKHRLRLAESPALTAHLQQLIDLATSPRSTPFTPTLCSSLLTVLITEVLDTVCSFPKKAESKDASKMRGNLIFERCHSFIKSNLSHPLKASELAMQAGIGFRQLSRIFIQQCGESPHQYIMRRRLDQARMLIDSTPSASIKQIAFDCGFTSSSHFTMAFKKTLGISPSTYAARKMKRK